MLYYLPLYFETAKQLTPIEAGVALFPQTFTVAPASLAVGVLVSNIGHYRWAIWSGWVLTTLGMGLMYTLDMKSPTVAWVFPNIVSGLGTGILFPSTSFAIQASCSDADVAYAVAMMTFLRELGQSFGVAIGGIIFQNSFKSRLLRLPSVATHAVEYSTNAVALVQIIRSMPDALPEREQIVGAYVDSLRIVWISICAFAFVGLLSSLVTEELPLDREHEPEQGFVHRASLRNCQTHH